MRRLLHHGWPVAAVALLTALLVLQIPRKALFFAPAARPATVTPFASFVTFDDDAYAALVRRMRMAWQMRGRVAPGTGGESRTDAIAFADPLPAPDYLPLPAAFAASAAPLDPPEAPLPPLLPPTLAEPMPPLPAVPAALDRDPDLLALPDSLLPLYPTTNYQLPNYPTTQGTSHD